LHSREDPDNPALIYVPTETMAVRPFHMEFGQGVVLDHRYAGLIRTGIDE
jgi:hypothetical protein